MLLNYKNENHFIYILLDKYFIWTSYSEYCMENYFKTMGLSLVQLTKKSLQLYTKFIMQTICPGLSRRLNVVNIGGCVSIL